MKILSFDLKTLINELKNLKKRESYGIKILKRKKFNEKNQQKNLKLS